MTRGVSDLQGNSNLYSMQTSHQMYPGPQKPLEHPDVQKIKLGMQTCRSQGSFNENSYDNSHHLGQSLIDLKGFPQQDLRPNKLGNNYYDDWGSVGQSNKYNMMQPFMQSIGDSL